MSPLPWGQFNKQHSLLHLFPPLSLPIQPCQQFCRRVHDVCGEEIRGLSAFTDLLNEVVVTFDCESLPQPEGGEPPECYQQTRTLARAAPGPSKWVGGVGEELESARKNEIGNRLKGKQCTV